MNPIDQQIAIAESQGIVERGGGPLGIYYQDKDGEGDRFFLDPIDASSLNLPFCDAGIVYQPLPNYLNNLNAMHEVVCGLSPAVLHCFLDNLCIVTNGESAEMDGSYVELGKMFTAKPAQWAEAYLRTINKWKD